jgi:hypothetical protein
MSYEDEIMYCFCIKQVEYEKMTFGGLNNKYFVEHSLDRWEFNYMFYLELQGKSIFDSNV